jgi:hypothetical protein
MSRYWCIMVFQPSHQCHKEPIHLVVDGGYGHMCLGYNELVGQIGPFIIKLLEAILGCN